MKITYKGDYAVKTLLFLSLHYGEGPVSIHELAFGYDMPNKFLEQVLLDLKRAGFVNSKRGKVGGYFLAKHPSQIKLGEVVRFIDGPIEPVACVDNKYKGCRDIHICVFRDVWCDVTKAISRVIDNITFEDLVKKIKKNNGSFVYQI